VHRHFSKWWISRTNKRSGHVVPPNTRFSLSQLSLNAGIYKWVVGAPVTDHQSIFSKTGVRRESLNERIKEYDRRIERMAKEQCPETALLIPRRPLAQTLFCGRLELHD
jgi:hypothetical protein